MKPIYFSNTTEPASSAKLKARKNNFLRIKIIFLIIVLIISATSFSFSQKVDDALRYSQIFYGGTARFMSMGGAFTAVGGDISSLSQNPAGIGVFRSSEMTVTPQLYHINTLAGFNGINSDYLYNFNLGQAGFVANFINKNSGTGLLSFNFGYSFNKTNNFHQSIRIQGISNHSSMADYWADASYGYYHDQLAEFVPAAYPAYETFIIDTLSGSNTEYGTPFSNFGDNPPSVYGQNMQRLISVEGYTGEHAISFGGNYSNKIFFGATFGITSLNYISHYEHLESTKISYPSNFTDFNSTYHYENKGTGYSFKIGGIFRPVESLRIGLAFHAPIWFTMDVLDNDNLISHIYGGKYEMSNGALRYNYALATPFRLLAGLAYQFKKVAILSFDYEFIDYGNAKFSETGDNYNYTEKNQNIKNTLQPASNIRIGGEYRFNNIYARGGYAYYGKAIRQGDINEDLYYNSLSLGAGFREQNFSIDFGYTRLVNSEKYLLYDCEAETAIADLSIDRNIFSVTFGFKFR